MAWVRLVSKAEKLKPGSFNADKLGITEDRLRGFNQRFVTLNEWFKVTF